MTEEDKRKVNYVKGIVDSYHTMKAQAIQKNFIAAELNAKINGVGSQGFIKMPDKNSNHNPNWRSPLFEELEQIEQEITALLIMCAKVDRFMSKLNPKDREIIFNLHYRKDNKKAYSNYCYECNTDRVGLYRYVNALIIKHW